MLAVVLILHHRLNLGQAGGQRGLVLHPVAILAVGVAAPFDIGGGQIGLVGPEPLVDHRLQTCAISAGL